MINVLIIDDSKLIRDLLFEIINAAPDMQVCGQAEDPYVGRDMIKQLKPDVITLDIEMPKMDGITFLKNLMRLKPMPVVMISTLTEKNADITLEALSIGAIDFITKPKIDQQRALPELASDIQDKIRIANKSKARLRTQQLQRKTIDTSTKPQIKKDKNDKFNNCLIAIGASTGGTEAIDYILNQLPEHTPPIVITQHIPEEFSKAFAKRLDRDSLLNVDEAKSQQMLSPSSVYVSPGNRHLVVKKRSGFYLSVLDDGDKVSGHKPSVDVLFSSLSKHIGDAKVLSIILTGMGQDGAEGMLLLREAGAYTVAQDERSSVVWGMPGAAVDIGAVDQILSLEKIPPFICQYFGLL